MDQGLFDKLLEKPESYRKKVAYIATGVIGLMIFTGWMFVMGQSLKSASVNGNTPPTRTAEEIRKNLPSLKDEQTVKTQLMKEQEQEAAGGTGQESNHERSTNPAATDNQDSSLIER